MKYLYLFLVAFALALPLAARPAEGCTPKGRFYHEFAEAEYVFIGRVAGYTEGIPANGATTASTSGNRDRNASARGYGLKVEPIGILNAPTSPERYFEVFPLVLAPDCSQSGTDLATLEKTYAVGSEVRVVMRDAKVFTANVPPGVVRVEEIAGLRGSLIDNGTTDPRFRTSIDAKFDYKAFDYAPKAVDAYAQLSLIEFELRKDLNRLEIARTRAERISILRRMNAAPRGVDFDMATINYTFTH